MLLRNADWVGVAHSDWEMGSHMAVTSIVGPGPNLSSRNFLLWYRCLAFLLGAGQLFRTCGIVSRAHL